jgi:hypothetical protein
MTFVHGRVRRVVVPLVTGTCQQVACRIEDFVKPVKRIGRPVRLKTLLHFSLVGLQTFEIPFVYRPDTIVMEAWKPICSMFPEFPRY